MTQRIMNLLLSIIDTFELFFNILTKPLVQLIEETGLDVNLGILENIIGDTSLFTLMFTSSIVIFLVITIVNWVLPT